jgi:PKD repeat protein
VQDSTNKYNYLGVSFSYNSNVNYLWDFGDGTSSTDAYPVHEYAGTGPYLLCLTVSDGNGCSDTKCDSLMAGKSTDHLTFTAVNGMSTTGINEKDARVNTLENYPNPFSGSTTINYSFNKPATIELSVVDLLGNKIAVIESGNKTAGNYSATWNAENVSEGMYLLQLKVDNKISTKKLVINK